MSLSCRALRRAAVCVVLVLGGCPVLAAPVSAAPDTPPECAPDSGLTAQKLADAVKKANTGTDVIETWDAPEAGCTITLTDKDELDILRDGTVSLTATGGGVTIARTSGNFGIFELFGEKAALSLTGFTLTGGRNDRAGGGAITIEKGTVTLTGCTVTNNETTRGDGGGIFNQQDGTLTISDTTVSGNKASGAGGGIATGGSLTVTGASVIKDNHAMSGGGIFTDTHQSKEATLTGTSVTGNVAERGGGGGILNTGTLTATALTITGNHASNDGYGPRGGGGLLNSGAATLADLTATGNVTTGNGGGIANSGGLATLTLNGTNTVADNSGYNGGGIANGEGGGELTMATTTISGNKAEQDGGGVRNERKFVSTSSTIKGNTASWLGGGLNNIYGDATLTDTSITGNQATEDGGGIWTVGDKITVEGASPITDNKPNNCATATVTGCQG